MRRLLFLLAFLCASVAGYAQSPPPLRITEVDGSPTKTNATRLNFPNGSLTVSGNTVTVAASGSFSAPVVITSNSAACFEVGANGSTNPVFRVVCNVASQAAGVSITGNAAGSGAVINTLSSGSNENLYILSKGTGAVAVSNATFTPTASAALHVEKAAISGREIMGKFTVSDGGNSAFFINNVTNNAALYVPTMSGYADSLNTIASFGIQGMVSAANDASDSAAGGIIALQAQRTDSTTDPINGTLSAVVNRKLFSIANFTTVRLVLMADGRLYGTALHNNAGAVTGTTNQYIASGTYTPTLTNVTNVAASTAYACQWTRVGNVVTVSGKFDLDATAAAATELGISLPIASALTAEEQLGGTAVTNAATSAGGRINADATNDRAQVRMTVTTITNDSYSFTFTYVIL